MRVSCVSSCAHIVATASAVTQFAGLVLLLTPCLRPLVPHFLQKGLHLMSRRRCTDVSPSRKEKILFENSANIHFGRIDATVAPIREKQGTDVIPLLVSCIRVAEAVQQLLSVSPLDPSDTASSTACVPRSRSLAQ